MEDTLSKSEERAAETSFPSLKKTKVQKAKLVSVCTIINWHIVN